MFCLIVHSDDESNEDSNDLLPASYDVENDTNQLNAQGMRSDLAITTEQKQSAVDYLYKTDGTRRKLSSIQKKCVYVTSYKQIQRWRVLLQGWLYCFYYFLCVTQKSIW